MMLTGFEWAADDRGGGAVGASVAGSGLTFDGGNNELDVLLASDNNFVHLSGLAFNDRNGGLQVTTNGGSGGMYLDGGGLNLALKEVSGLEFAGINVGNNIGAPNFVQGLRIDLATEGSGLEIVNAAGGAGGLSVDLAANSGLAITDDGLALASRDEYIGRVDGGAVTFFVYRGETGTLNGLKANLTDVAPAVAPADNALQDIPSLLQFRMLLRNEYAASKGAGYTPLSGGEYWVKLTEASVLRTDLRKFNVTTGAVTNNQVGSLPYRIIEEF